MGNTVEKEGKIIMSYGYKKIINDGFEETEAKVRDALTEHSFGVITEIDVRNTFKQKLDIDFNKYKILGACQPQIAHAALSLDKQIGLLLPCNVVLWENDDGTTTVAAINAYAQLALAEIDELIDHATEVNEKLKAVLDCL